MSHDSPEHLDWARDALAAWEQRGCQGVVALPMRECTTFRIGGPADLVLFPETEDDVLFAQRLARQMHQSLQVVGACSNVLVRDGGMRGVVLRTAKCWEWVVVEGRRVRASAGTRLPLLAATARRAGLAGLEFCNVIPGTVGGALVQNAGAGKQCVADVFAVARVLDADGSIHEADASGLSFGNRSSALQGSAMVALEATFELTADTPDRIAERQRAHRARRRERLPLSKPGAGSIFRRPDSCEESVGAIIERAGCTGWRSGGAFVSRKHANFILNGGSATASDVLSLVQRIRQAVRGRCGLDLELEICVMGNDSCYA